MPKPKQTLADIDPRLDEIHDCLYRLSVKAIIVQDQKVLLVKEEDDEWWSVPGGGVDHGEDALSALNRELSEELGVSAAQIRINEQVAFVTLGAIVDHIPKVNIFYRVEIPPNSVKPTKAVQAHQLFSLDELDGLYLSPSTGDDLVGELTKLMK